MKKFGLFLIIALALYACKKEPVLTLQQTSATLKSGENFSITATGFDSYQFTSEDEYVAKVSASGIVSAQRVGNTKIVVKAEDKVAYFSVNVIPEYVFFTEPITEWGMSRSQLISRLGTPSTSTADGVGYTSSSTIAPMSIYLFDANGLSVSSTIITTSYSSLLGSFMAERYYPFAYDSDEYSIYFINALSVSKATTIIALGLYSTSYWMAVYIRNDNYTKGGLNSLNSEIFKKIDKIVQQKK